MSNIEVLDDKFYDLFNGKENIIGTNKRYLEKRLVELNKNQLKNKNKIASIYSELGKDTKGRKKPKVCWTFVKNGFCNHCINTNVNGKIFSNLWHPGDEERSYLYKKKYIT